MYIFPLIAPERRNSSNLLTLNSFLSKVIISVAESAAFCFIYITILKQTTTTNEMK